MNKSQLKRIKEILDEKEHSYNNISFIEKDPISIPHSFANKQDIEIMGLFASVFAWGKRSIIIDKCKDLSNRMSNTPFLFITQHDEEDLKRLLGFKHRTFNDTDLLYFVDFLKKHYSKFDTLEEAFVPEGKTYTTEQALNHFCNYFFDGAESNFRTRKHVSAPANKSACKRLNMYLRWMVRKDNKGVDFGIWNRIQAKDLICPLDVHVERTAKILGLLTRKQPDWMAAIELTNNLKLLDKNDPVKYDFALFGLSIEKGIDAIS